MNGKHEKKNGRQERGEGGSERRRTWRGESCVSGAHVRRHVITIACPEISVVGLAVHSVTLTVKGSP